MEKVERFLLADWACAYKCWYVVNGYLKQLPGQITQAQIYSTDIEGNTSQRFISFMMQHLSYIVKNILLSMYILVQEFASIK